MCATKTIEELKEIFPDLVEGFAPYDSSGREVPGVYCIDMSSGSKLIKIVGPCPNLDERGNCRVHDKRLAGCKKYERDDYECRRTRALGLGVAKKAANRRYF